MDIGASLQRRPGSIRSSKSEVGANADRATEDLFNGSDTRRARRACSAALWSVARRKLTQLNRVRDLTELAIPPGNHLERLRGDRAGQCSIRINEQYRIRFRWKEGYAGQVEVTDYH